MVNVTDKLRLTIFWSFWVNAWSVRWWPGAFNIFKYIVTKIPLNFPGSRPRKTITLSANKRLIKLKPLIKWMLQINSKILYRIRTLAFDSNNVLLLYCLYSLNVFFYVLWVLHPSPCINIEWELRNPALRYSFHICAMLSLEHAFLCLRWQRNSILSANGKCNTIKIWGYFFVNNFVATVSYETVVTDWSVCFFFVLSGIDTEYHTLAMFTYGIVNFFFIYFVILLKSLRS